MSRAREDDDDDDDECPALVGVDQAIANSPSTDEQPQRQKKQTKKDEDEEAALLDPELLKTIPVVPLVILSGFLGSGKTSLLQYVLAAEHGMRIAVIVNEFEFGRSIEKGLTVRSADADSEGEWVELRNGCMCCSAKSQSVQALEQLVVRRRGALDAILVETAGMADPIPIARSFWLDEALQAKVRLAGIVAIVDTANIERYIKGDKFVEAARQLLAADRIIMNKLDLVGSSVSFVDAPDAVQRELVLDREGKDDVAATIAESPLARAAQTIREVNPVAPIILTSLRRLMQLRDDRDEDNGVGRQTATGASSSALIPIEKLRALLLLDGDDSHQRPQNTGVAAVASSGRWIHAPSQHVHSNEVCATEIEVVGRVFRCARDVDFFFARVLDNTVDGQDEHDEKLPAQLKAKQRGSVVVRSKAALWVAAAQCESGVAGRPSALQVQSIGATFEALPMAGLNSISDERRRSEILATGTNRLLLLGFGLRAAEMKQLLLDTTIPLEQKVNSEQH